MQRPPRRPRAVLWSQPRRLVRTLFRVQYPSHVTSFDNCADGLLDAAIIRNAGGRASDALRSIATLDAIAGIAAIVVVHHTGECGTTTNLLSL